MKNIWFVIFWMIVGIFVAFGVQNIYGKVKSNNGSPSNSNSSLAAISNTDHPKTSVSISNSPYLGDKSKAKMAIVEFSDLECPYCKRFHDQTFDSVVKEFVDSGRAIFVYRNYPLDFHKPAATTDAKAALCVNKLGDNSKYFQMIKSIFGNTAQNGRGMEISKYSDLADQIGIDKDRFKQCLDSSEFDSQIQKDLEDGTAAGVSGTPGFVIGKLGSDGQVSGELLSGAQPLSEFKAVITKYD